MAPGNNQTGLKHLVMGKFERPLGGVEATPLGGARFFLKNNTGMEHLVMYWAQGF